MVSESESLWVSFIVKGGGKIEVRSRQRKRKTSRFYDHDGEFQWECCQRVNEFKLSSLCLLGKSGRLVLGLDKGSLYHRHRRMKERLDSAERKKDTYNESRKHTSSNQLIKVHA